MIEYWLESLKDFNKIPGMSVALVKDQQLVWSKGYGYADLQKKIPIEAGTLCSIRSISKLFTSVAIMQLWEQGKIRLDDSLSMYLPAVKLKQDFESVSITIRALLTHSAGFSSSALDPARFAQWQLRLLQGGTKELLKPSTLKEMQRVQWINPDGGATWGLGFVVSDAGGTRVVGHYGSCPGYRTVVIIEPKSKWGEVVMVNAAEINPWDYAAKIMKIMRQYEAQKPSTVPSPRNLADYAGLYNGMDWGSEAIYLPLKGRLISLNFPTADPTGNTPRLLAPTQVPDQFRQVRTDEIPGQRVEFERNASGKVTRVLQNKNSSEKMR